MFGLIELSCYEAAFNTDFTKNGVPVKLLFWLTDWLNSPQVNLFNDA